MHVDPSPVLTLAQLLQLLQISEATFNRRRAAMEAAGFPHRIPGLGRWSRAAVIAWIDRPDALAAGNDNPGQPLDPIAMARGELEQRIGLL